MSRGPGRIERVISAVFDAEPSNAFTVEDLADRVFPGINRVEKKHRVTILRAADRVWRKRGEIGFYRSEMLGGTIVYFRQDSVMSYAMARMKADWLNRYRSNDPRCKRWWLGTEEDLRAKLSNPKDRHYELVQPGGAWWKQTLRACAAWRRLVEARALVDC
jgi:hypothetical protein